MAGGAGLLWQAIGTLPLHHASPKLYQFPIRLKPKLPKGKQENTNDLSI
jgi:hypothetical protein